MPSTRSKVIWICVVLIVAAVHAFASFATRKQRALIHELELVAFALFLPSCLCRTRSNLACTFPD